MLTRFIPLFILIPILELWLLFKLASHIGFLLTLMLVIATAFIGVSLLRMQGLSTLARFQKKMAATQIPTQEIAEGLLLFFAGGLLLTPGILTDVLGFFILYPRGRQWFVKRIAKFLQKNTQSYTEFQYRQQTSEHRNNKSADYTVIEGQYEEIDPK